MHTILSLGVDPLFFCLLFTIWSIVGYLSPPFAISVFYLKGSLKKDILMGTLYRAVLPFLAIMVIVSVLCTLLPDMVLWLPRKM